MIVSILVILHILSIYNLTELFQPLLAIFRTPETKEENVSGTLKMANNLLHTPNKLNAYQKSTKNIICGGSNMKSL